MSGGNMKDIYCNVCGKKLFVEKGSEKTVGIFFKKRWYAPLVCHMWKMLWWYDWEICDTARDYGGSWIVKW